ncbi:HNH/ENDO VII family nuclease [uncultured Corynebacterium sp.]|uniref:HNH/ENDO VII family nuclease n=3 Tax=Corynebacterium TaxID=1716 RepID=UPI0025E72C09|nr:HNH/ENDO VII family nuclease [uncultured Corynebacterium sp.]
MGALEVPARATHSNYQAAVTALNTAEVNAARARLAATAATATAVSTSMIPGVGAATAAAAASAEADSKTAQAALKAARLHFEEVKTAWLGHISTSDAIKTTLGEEVDSAVGIIAAQAKADFDDNPNWLERAWQKTKDWVSDHADVLAAISDIMQIVGSVLLLVPGLQAIGAGLLIAGIGLKALLAATGNASWGEVLFDVVTSLPFAGIAKLAKAGKLGNTVAKATHGMGKAASAVKAAAKSGANSAALKMANGASRVAGEAGEKFAKSAYSKITRGGQICFAAEPVDMATGNMVDFTQDINIPGTLPLIIDRNANSAHELGRALGSRWVSRMDVHIEILDDEVLMVSPDGALLTFPPAPLDGSEVRADGRAWLLSFADGAYRVRNVAEGITYVFSVSGDGSYVTTSGVEDRSPAAGGHSAGAGLRTGSFAADLGLGFTVGVTALVHHTGAAITYSWDQATGQMRDIMRSDGTHLSLVWDHATNRVASIWVDNQQTHPDEAPQRLISYEYDAAGQLIRVVNSHAGVLSYFYDEQGRTAGWRDRNGAAYHYRYDDHGRVTAQVGTGGMFPNILYWGDDTGDDAPAGGTVCVLIETAGDFTGNPLDTGDSVVDTYLDRLHNLPLYQALLNGGLEQAGLTGRGRTTNRDTTDWTIPTNWLTDDLLGDIRPTVYRATASGDVWRIISPEGAIQDTTYTDHHLPATVTNAAGATTSYTYDDNDLITDTTYPDGTTTTIEPGTWGMPVRITGRDGHTTDYQVDTFGMTTAITTADGATTTYTYDYRVTGITPASITNPDGATTHIDCDNAGRTIAITDPAGRRTSHTLNIQGLVTDTLDPDGNTTRIDYTPEGWPTTLTHPDGTTLTATYDGEGNQLSSTNEMGATTTTTYTVFDKPITTTDATGATTTITYNTQMQPVAITNADGHTWTYTYNLDGNITQQTDYNGIVTTNTTSPDGLVSAVTTPAGTTTTTYNQLGLTTSVEDASGTTLFDYDPVGRLTSITNPAATVTYTRDAYGRAMSETTRLASGEETRHTIELSATGMVTGEHLTLPTAGTITTGYGRNAAGEITSSTITQHTTPAVTHDRHTETSAPAGLDHTGRLLAELTYTTNTRGHRATTAIDNLVRTIDIDTRGRITGDHTNLLDSTTTGGLIPVAGRDFTWQADSTLTAITDQLRGTTSFTVDAIGRATSATRTPQPTTNPSDQGTTPPHTPARAGTPAQSGNATSGVSAQENYSFTPAGVLASTTDGVIDYHNTLPVKVGRTTYTYDAAGRITRTVTKRLGKKPLVHHFYYATGEQPIGFSSSDAPGVGYRYTYDGLGRRVAKDTINTTTGEVTHRDVFTHTGNQLAAVTTTIDTTDPTRVGEGYVWTTDPATGDTHGQITLTTSSTNGTPVNPAAGWSQARVDATFYALVCDLAGAPQELINTTTGVVEGHTTQTLYGKRTWSGRCTSPLLFAGQYEDAESGWAYNRFRYYNPTLGAYNAQDPLGLAPRLASAQGYVDHAAFWVDMLGLVGKEAHTRFSNWYKETVAGKEVYKSAPGHVFDPHKQLRTMGGGTETNLDRMARGKAPIGHDGKFVNLHHIGQSDSSTLVELTATRHSQNRAQLHIFHGLSRNDFPKDVVPVDRSAFDAWREQYWIERAKDFQ